MPFNIPFVKIQHILLMFRVFLTYAGVLKRVSIHPCFFVKYDKKNRGTLSSGIAAFNCIDLSGCPDLYNPGSFTLFFRWH